jgi:hypothetical protein
MKKLSALVQGLGLLVLATAVSGQAYANTAGGATIHNVATLSFTGGSNVAAVDVGVQTVAAMPTAAVTPSAQNVIAYATASYTVTLTSNSNGADTIHLALTSVDNNTTGAPGLTFLLNGTPVTSVNLGASITSQASTAGKIFIPAGSQGNLSSGSVVSIGGNLYTVGTITAGTIATTVGGVTTAEVATQVALTPVGAAPAITAGSVPAGTQVGQQITLVEQVVATAPSSPVVIASHTVNFTATTTATDLAGNPVVYSSTAPGDVATTVTTISLATTSLTKYVRNVSRASANTTGSGSVNCGTANTYYATGVTAKTTDVLEYCLMATVTAGQPNMTGAVLKDALPQYTTYVTNSTSMNGSAVADVTGTTPINTASGLAIKSPGAASAGTIVAGETAVVLFQVDVQ